LAQEGKKVKMILDINQSTYYYNSALFKPENRKIILKKNLKKTTREDNKNEPWRNEEFHDTESALTDDIVYVKAPLSTNSLTHECSASLKAVFEVLDQYVQEDSSTNSENGLESNFDNYVLVH
jgi:hypothetical protein